MNFLNHLTNGIPEKRDPGPWEDPESKTLWGSRTLWGPRTLGEPTTLGGSWSLVL